MTGWTSWCYDLVLKKKEMKKKQNKSLEEKNRLSFCSRDWNSKMTIGCQKTKQTCSRTEWMALHLSLSFLFMEIVWLKRLCKLKYADQWIGLHDHELAYNCNQNWIPDTNSFSLKEERFFSSSFLSLLYRLWHRSLWQEQFLFYFFFGLLFFLFLLFISFLLLLVVGLGCFIRFGLDPTRPAFAFLRVRVIEGRVFFPSVRTDDGERNLSIVQSRPNGLCPTPAQIRPRATRSTFALSPLFVRLVFSFSLFFLLQPFINVGSGAIFIPLFFFFFVVLLFLFDSSLWNVSLFYMPL